MAQAPPFIPTFTTEPPIPPRRPQPQPLIDVSYMTQQQLLDVQRQVSVALRPTTGSAQDGVSFRYPPAGGVSLDRPPPNRSSGAALGRSVLESSTASHVSRGSFSAKLRMYHGPEEQDFHLWANHVRDFVHLHSIEEHAAIRLAKMHLSGKAEAMAAPVLTDQIFLTLDEFLVFLSDVYEPKAASEIHKVQFETATQQPDETLLEWFARLLRLFALAFPKENWSRSEIAVRQFMNGIKDENLRIAVRRAVSYAPPPVFIQRAREIAVHEATVVIDSQKVVESHKNQWHRLARRSFNPSFKTDNAKVASMGLDDDDCDEPGIAALGKRVPGGKGKQAGRSNPTSRSVTPRGRRPSASPRRRPTSRSPGRSKGYCLMHGSGTHVTDDCIKLKALIKERKTTSVQRKVSSIHPMSSNDSECTPEEEHSEYGSSFVDEETEQNESLKALILSSIIPTDNDTFCGCNKCFSSSDTKCEPQECVKKGSMSDTDPNSVVVTISLAEAAQLYALREPGNQTGLQRELPCEAGKAEDVFKGPSPRSVQTRESRKPSKEPQTESNQWRSTVVPVQEPVAVVHSSTPQPGGEPVKSTLSAAQKRRHRKAASRARRAALAAIEEQTSSGSKATDRPTSTPAQETNKKPDPVATACPRAESASSGSPPKTAGVPTATKTSAGAVSAGLGIVTPSPYRLLRTGEIAGSEGHKRHAAVVHALRLRHHQARISYMRQVCGVTEGILALRSIEDSLEYPFTGVCDYLAPLESSPSPLSRVPPSNWADEVEAEQRANSRRTYAEAATLRPSRPSRPPPPPVNAEGYRTSLEVRLDELKERIAFMEGNQPVEPFADWAAYGTYYANTYLSGPLDNPSNGVSPPSVVPLQPPKDPEQFFRENGNIIAAPPQEVIPESVPAPERKESTPLVSVAPIIVIPKTEQSEVTGPTLGPSIKQEPLKETTRGVSALIAAIGTTDQDEESFRHEENHRQMDSRDSSANPRGSAKKKKKKKRGTSRGRPTVNSSSSSPSPLVVTRVPTPAPRVNEQRNNAPGPETFPLPADPSCEGDESTADKPSPVMVVIGPQIPPGLPREELRLPYPPEYQVPNHLMEGQTESESLTLTGTDGTTCEMSDPAQLSGEQLLESADLHTPSMSVDSPVSVTDPLHMALCHADVGEEVRLPSTIVVTTHDELYRLFSRVLTTVWSRNARGLSTSGLTPGARGQLLVHVPEIADAATSVLLSSGTLTRHSQPPSGALILSGVILPAVRPELLTRL